MRITVRHSSSLGLSSFFALSWFRTILWRRGSKKGRDETDDGVPVTPNRPDILSGGAAAPLEFDE
jgi:hypothetical protein